MSGLRQQLDRLRARVAAIDRKYAGGPPPAAPGDSQPDSYWLGRSPSQVELPAARAQATAQSALEEWLGGREVATPYGRHFETDTLYAAHRRHGSADIGALGELPSGLLEAISGGAAPSLPPARWAFLDTETTGISGNSGDCAFLVGIGRITPEGFLVRQFFMRNLDEEASLLDAVARYLAPFGVLITYNGRAFDQPLLETRCLLNNAPEPFARLAHLDLLHGARRLWKLRYQSCRLVDLEQQVLGFEREGDVPGALIPYLYFEYLRTRHAARLLPVFRHNNLDILTLACLTAIVPYAFQRPSAGDCPAGDRTAGLRHPAEMVGMARWLRQAGDLEQARVLLRRAADADLPADLLHRTLWDLAQLERKLDAVGPAVELWTGLASCVNPFRVPALEELAKHHEHRAKDHARALELTRQALEHLDSPALRRREQRLLAHLARAQAKAQARAQASNKAKTRAKPSASPKLSSLASVSRPRRGASRGSNAAEPFCQ